MAYRAGAPLPRFLTRARFDAFAAVDEDRLRAGLKRSERVMRHTTSALARGGLLVAGTTLARTIRFSRQQALLGPAYPLSTELKDLYAPYFPEELLERVRWSIADGRPGLGTALAGWYYREGAVTLGDVVVYSNAKAANHRWLVAHELTHVLQYEQLGIDDFARLYASDWPLIERQARRNATRIVEDIRRSESDATPRAEDLEPPPEFVEPIVDETPFEAGDDCPPVLASDEATSPRCQDIQTTTSRDAAPEETE